MIRRKFVILVFFVATLSGASAAQTPVFRGDVETVVTVTDEQGRIITGLTKDDFTIYDEEQLQEITAFTDERVPVSLGVLLDISDSMVGQPLVDARRAPKWPRSVASDLRRRGHRQRSHAHQGARPHAAERPVRLRHRDRLVEVSAREHPPPSPEALREITGRSGGYTEVVRSSADLGPATERIAYELNHQYTLAYNSSHTPDGSWRRIRVRMRNTDHFARARRGYFSVPPLADRK